MLLSSGRPGMTASTTDTSSCRSVSKSRFAPRRLKTPICYTVLLFGVSPLKFLVARHERTRRSTHANSVAARTFESIHHIERR